MLICHRLNLVGFGYGILWFSFVVLLPLLFCGVFRVVTCFVVFVVWFGVFRLLVLVCSFGVNCLGDLVCWIM